MSGWVYGTGGKIGSLFRVFAAFVVSGCTVLQESETQLGAVAESKYGTYSFRDGFSIGSE